MQRYRIVGKLLLIMNTNDYLQQSLRVGFPKVAGFIKKKHKKQKTYESISSLKWAKCIVLFSKFESFYSLQVVLNVNKTLDTFIGIYSQQS